MAMTKDRRTVGIIITLSIFLPMFLQTESVESPFEIILFRRIVNTITLQCRLTATSLPIPDAVFFLNDSRLENVTELHLGEDHGVSFQIIRDLEGYFACGNDSLMSNPLALIAVPDSRLLHNPPPVYATLGERVQLNCIISPGRLLQQYSIAWERSGTVIYESRSSPPSLDNRYSTNPLDLSLNIDNVRLEDANKAYKCILTVVDPNADQTYQYMNLQFYNISLVVLAHPMIASTPRENTTIEGHNASFTCSVRGFPAPVIEWELNGIVQSRNSSTDHTHRDGDYWITSSIFIIVSVKFSMNGDVRCIGRIPSAMTGDKVLDDANSTATLVVYSPPSIDQSRLRDSTVAVGENTSFVCSAEGYPPPMITWFLNGTRVLQQDPGNKVNMMSSQNGPYNVTTSEIVITPAKQILNGFVKCLARSSTAEIDLPDDNFIVELVVLGYFGLRVDVTQRGDVLFEVTLPTPLSKPVKLMIEYIDLDDLFRRQNVTTSIAYDVSTTTSFLHLERSSLIPFKQFKVSVRLVSLFIIGPPVQDINDHATNQPTLVDPNILKHEENKHIIKVVVISGVVLGVVFFVWLFINSYLCYKLRRTRIILCEPNNVLKTFMKEIKKESNSENYRKRLIEEARKLAIEIAHYRKQRKITYSDILSSGPERQLTSAVAPDDNQAETNLNSNVSDSMPASSGTDHIHSESNNTSNKQGEDGIEMQRIEGDSTARGPPPPPHLTNVSHPPQHTPVTSNGYRIDDSHDNNGSAVSPVDRALDAFVRDLRCLIE